MRRHVFVAWLAGLSFSVYLTSLACAAPFSVAVVQSENTGAYEEFSSALRASLPEGNITLTTLDTSQTLPNSNLVIAVGMKAASVVAASEAPVVLNVLLPKSGHAKLLRDFPKRDHTSLFSTIYLDQPIERHLALIAAAFPDRHRIGVLFSPPTPDEVTQLRQKAGEYGFKLYEHEVATSSSLFESLQDVLQHSDVLLALPAPSIYNSSTLRNILVSTFQSGIPLVGFSSSYVKAGAMCAVSSSPSHLASQASVAIRKYSETGELPPAQHPKLYEITVNERVAQSLGISIKSADELLKIMTAGRRRTP